MRQNAFDGRAPRLRPDPLGELHRDIATEKRETIGRRREETEEKIDGRGKKGRGIYLHLLRG